ncbi:MAG: prolyl oligopeptidase family serine peptidase [Planctomycetaceae bacterium]|nr:prolyl oligopeptidase family serine peptidase [Planctomycetaceae bacterium]
MLLYQKFVEPPERSLKPAGHVQPELSDEAGAPSPQETSTRTSSKPPVFNRVTYQKRRAAFTSNLEYKGPSPQEYETFNTPAGVEEVVYESEGLELKAWVDRRGASEEKSPAIVYFHGGFAIALSSIEEACAQFREAGFVVMCPTLRGENGNPGNFELFLGEVDDAANACRWLAQQDYVDQDRIYTFGHSVGGGISTLLSLQEDLPVAYTGSSGGLYSVHTFFSWREIVPFDWTSQSEKKIRILSGNIADMLTPHIAYIGTEDLPFHSTIYAVQNEKKKDSFLTVRKVHGDHFTSFDVAVKEYIKLLKALPKSSPAHTSEPETDRTGNQ